MTPERWQQVGDTLHQVLRFPAQQRSAYLSEIASRDPELVMEVESLLASYEQAGTAFLSGSAIETLDEPSAGETMVGQRLGAYQVAGLIGIGGMGEVYRAGRADDQYRKQVALKLVRAGQDTGFVVARFKNERQILASLDHPNIARLIDAGSTAEGVPYFVMELIEGEPIDEYCARHRLPISDRLQMFLQVCSAVQFAHQRLIVHRDLKPSNILVTHEGMLKLLDFGIAKLLDPSAAGDGQQATATLFRVLTPGYASPEQIRGEPITTASDVYSLGVVLYELLTGRSPYPISSRTPHEIARAVCDLEPQRPSIAVRRTERSKSEKTQSEDLRSPRDISPEKLSKYLSGDLDNIVLMALRKEPQRRYASVERFADDIRRHLKDLPVTARQDTVKYRVSKFVTRHKAGVTGSAVVVLTLVAALTITLHEAHIAKQQAELAREERARAERRFNDVRELANSLIFEIHDSVRNVPGATATRKLIVERALKYLDSLARESSADLSLQRELASAYVRIGKVQGGTDEANLGDTSASLASYQKALDIRTAVYAAEQRDLRNVEELSEAYRTVAEALDETGQTEKALENTQRARQLVEQAEPAHAEDVGLLQELVRDYESEANLLGGNFNRGTVGDSANAVAQRRKELEVSERLAKLRPSDSAMQRFVAVSVTQMGDQLLMGGQWRESTDYYVRAKAVFERLAAQSPSAREELEYLHATYQRLQFIRLQEGETSQAILATRRALEIASKLSQADPNDVWSRANLADDYSNLAGALSRKPDFRRQAVSAVEKAMSLMHELVTRDPKNAEFQGVQSAALTTAGDVYRRAGDYHRALGYYRQALAITEKIVAADSKNVASRMRLAANHNGVAAILLQLGDFLGAPQEYNNAATLVRATSSSNPPSEQALYASADSYTGLGDVESKLADQQAGLSNNVARRKRACGFYEASLKIWSKIREPGAMSPDGFECVPPAIVSARLNRCQAILGSAEARARN